MNIADGLNSGSVQFFYCTDAYKLIFVCLVIFLQVLKNAVLFLILAPYDNEQSDLIHRVGEEKTLDEIPLYRYVNTNNTNNTNLMSVLKLTSVLLK